jgi:hypothetical protein
MRNVKLDNDQRMFALRMYGEGMDSGEIRKEIKDRFDISITTSAILQTCRAKCNQPFVANFREAYMARIREVPIANKRIRLDDMEKLRKKLMSLIDSNPLKTKSDKSEFIAVSGRLNQIEAEAREEMERKPHFFQNVVVGMGDMSDEALHKRKQEIIRKIMKAEENDACVESNPNEEIFD